MQQRAMNRQLTMQTEIYATATAETVDDELDRLAVEVEKVMEATLLNDLAQNIMLSATTVEIDSDGEIPVGIMTLTWTVMYRTIEGDPETSV